MGLRGYQRGMSHGATGRGSEPARAPMPGVRVVLGSPIARPALSFPHQNLRGQGRAHHPQHTLRDVGVGTGFVPWPAFCRQCSWCALGTLYLLWHSPFLPPPCSPCSSLHPQREDVLPRGGVAPYCALLRPHALHPVHLCGW